MRRHWTLLLPLALAACGGPRKLVVKATLPGLDSTETPVAGLGFIALPYNRDSVIAALTAQAPNPRPPTAELDSLYARFRGPFAAYARASQRVRDLLDSVAVLRGRSDPSADSLAAVLAAAEQARDSAKSRLAGIRAELATRGDSLRRAIAAWQDTTFRNYDSVTKALTASTRLQPVADTTGPAGTKFLTLPPRGSWWITARSWDPLDPNEEWYWNVPVQGDTIYLNGRTGTRRPRY